MKDVSPGLSTSRLISLMRTAIDRCGLDLSGNVILTEAASGAYIVTPVMAAMAGADHVYALTHSTRYGTVEEITNQTLQLADQAKVGNRLDVITQKSREIVSRADIITNSGHVRPLDATMIGWMKPTAVITLMYEAWEFRPGDIDLAACRDRGIRVGGTNERHPAVDVFSFLGIMAIKMLADAGISVYASSILLLCDNPFSSFIERSLVGVGARVQTCQSLPVPTESGLYDAILVALRPRSEPVLSAEHAITIATNWPDTVVAQFWGDLDRRALLAAGVPVWPLQPPPPGHMGILPSEIGPDPTIRLQVGGLKAGEVLSRYSSQPGHQSFEFVDFLDFERANG
jgi:hypothetical protein